ncbi:MULTISPECIES: aldo/keto reductase [unclassified Streptomyces]|uniref:aldo/keto reductase n=1 Tax=unclassified Streptomyces TaxID=2593676 RepID=UPI000CD56345|nr:MULTISPECIES: aldo/keto reductase [unclassified Streptomyces]
MRAADPGIVLGLHRSRHDRGPLKAALDLGISRLDTAFNYLGFTSHTTLAEQAGDLLRHFTISTKVGFFPDRPGARHTLNPARLRAAVEQTVRDLRRPPDLVFLHNPERSTDGEPLADACAALDDAVRAGLAGAWGVSTWDPRPLLPQLDSTTPRPAVLMIRSGLLVPGPVLDAAEQLVHRWKPADVWGMSPFNASPHDPVWEAARPQVFLTNPPEGCTPLQAAFRAAYALPEVSTIAVGSDNETHLRELLGTLSWGVDYGVVDRYRRLLRARSPQ